LDRKLFYCARPNLLVMSRGRVGIVQVHGPHHRGPFVAEASRDRLYLHGDRLIFYVFGALAGLKRDLIRERTVAGAVRRPGLGP
jgi:hypothetical protein